MNHNNNIRSMHADLVCRNLGLLDGNCYGEIVSLEPDMKHSASGLVCDYETSCRVWQHQLGFVRFQMLCSDTKRQSEAGYQTALLAMHHVQEE